MTTFYLARRLLDTPCLMDTLPDVGDVRCQEQRAANAHHQTPSRRLFPPFVSCRELLGFDALADGRAGHSF